MLEAEHNALRSKRLLLLRMLLYHTWWIWPIARWIARQKMWSSQVAATRAPVLHNASPYEAGQVVQAWLVEIAVISAVCRYSQFPRWNVYFSRNCTRITSP